MSKPGSIERLLAIMAALRTPETGCPWDLEQNFVTIAPFTIEEAHEVADAIARGDRDDLKDELGDLLLQVVFHARLAEEEGSFAFADVVDAICTKMVRRHPHVFGDAGALPVEAVNRIWAEIKAAEKAAKAGSQARPAGILDNVGHGMPALAAARKLQARAAEVGFDWPDAAPVIAKIAEETEEVRAALAAGLEPQIAEEIGDLLFAMVNLARHCDVDPDMALRQANAKFARRFAAVERGLAARGKAPADSDLAEMEALWQAAKAADKAA
jgi:ATP diphosphatase